MRKKKIIIPFVVLGFVFFGVGALLAFASQLSEADLVHRVEAVGQEPSSAQTFDELAAQMEARQSHFQKSPLTWVWEGQRHISSPEELGVELDFTPVVSALAPYRQANVLEKAKLWVFGLKIAPTFSVDQEKKRSVQTVWGLEHGPVNASFALANEEVLVVESQAGTSINQPAFDEQLEAAWIQPNTLEFPLTMDKKEPAIQTADLQAHLDEAKILIPQDFTLRDDHGLTWTIALKEHPDWLIPGASTHLEWNPIALQDFVTQNITAQVEVTAQPVTITEAEGSYHFEGSAREGRSIDLTALNAQLNAALLGRLESKPAEPIDLVVQVVKPKITVPESLKLKGVTDLIGFGYSNFSGSPTNRIKNVTHGMAIFNGIVLEKDQEFSFTTLMGDIDAAHGWYPELVIKGDETIPEYGGGLCQVSSTMFRAALYTGMPITARRNHSYAVSYYARPSGYGLDATVYDPNPDFRFKNDTQGAILIQGYVQGNDAYFVFYGTNDGRTVQMEGPTSYGYTSIAEPVITYTDKLAPGVRELKEYAHKGFQVDWFRTITRADGTKSERENIHSNYEARPAKYLEGQPAAEVTEVAGPVEPTTR